MVVPHGAQRCAIQKLLRPYVLVNDGQFFAEIELPGIDTGERFQGNERDVTIVSAAESNPDYIRQNEQFLFDIRRLNLAFSRRTQINCCGITECD